MFPDLSRHEEAESVLKVTRTKSSCLRASTLNPLWCVAGDPPMTLAWSRTFRRLSLRPLVTKVIYSCRRPSCWVLYSHVTFTPPGQQGDRIGKFSGGTLRTFSRSAFARLVELVPTVHRGVDATDPDAGGLASRRGGRKGREIFPQSRHIGKGEDDLIAVVALEEAGLGRDDKQSHILW